MGRGDYRNYYYKAHMEKTKGEGGGGGGRWVQLGLGGGMGRKVIGLLLNNNKNLKKRKRNYPALREIASKHSIPSNKASRKGQPNTNNWGENCFS